jgi:hypothetical protein
MEGALVPRRSTGVTFIYPDKDVRKEIVRKTYGDKSEVDEATDLLKTHILYGALESASDFGSGVANRLDYVIKVDKSSGDKVKLDNGTTLTKVKKFTSGRGNTAVWEADGPVIASGERRERGGSKKMGGAPPSDRAWLQWFEGRMYQSYLTTGNVNEYLRAVISFVNYLKINHYDTFVMVYPILDVNPFLSFFLLFEPKKDRGPYMVDGGLITQWGGQNLYKNAQQEWAALFADSTRQEIAQKLGASAPKLFTDNAAVLRAIDSARSRVLQSNPATRGQSIQNAYQQLVSSNSLGGLSPIFPASTAAALANGKKLWQDESRFLLSDQVAGAANISSAKEFKTDAPGNDYVDELMVASDTMDVHPEERAAIQSMFINSTAFMYVPHSLTQGSQTMPIDDPQFYNLELAKLADLHKMTIPEFDIEGSIALLQAYQKSTQ